MSQFSINMTLYIPFHFSTFRLAPSFLLDNNATVRLFASALNMFACMPVSACFHRASRFLPLKCNSLLSIPTALPFNPLWRLLFFLRGDVRVHGVYTCVLEQLTQGRFIPSYKYWWILGDMMWRKPLFQVKLWMICWISHECFQQQWNHHKYNVFFSRVSNVMIPLKSKQQPFLWLDEYLLLTWFTFNRPVRISLQRNLILQADNRSHTKNANHRKI